VERIRIVPIHLPRLLSDILRAIGSGQGDVDVLPSVNDYGELVPLLRKGLVNVIVTSGGSATLPSTLSALLERRGGVRVLVLGDDGRVACLHELKPSSVLLTGESPKDLLDCLRAHIRSRPDWGCGERRFSVI
jgi:hypothetical protein